jgi:Icc-related predicted phosphoesterase
VKIAEPKNAGSHEGCADLRATISHLPELRLHVFGHIHTAYGRYEHDGVTFVNAAMLADDYSLREQPPVIFTCET